MAKGWKGDSSGHSKAAKKGWKGRRKLQSSLKKSSAISRVHYKKQLPKSMRKPFKYLFGSVWD